MALSYLLGIADRHYGVNHLATKSMSINSCNTNHFEQRLHVVLKLHNRHKTALNHRFTQHFRAIQSNRSTTFPYHTRVFSGLLQIHSRVLVQDLVSKHELNVGTSQSAFSHLCVALMDCSNEVFDLYTLQASSADKK